MLWCRDVAQMLQYNRALRCGLDGKIPEGLPVFRDSRRTATPVQGALFCRSPNTPSSERGAVSLS